MAITVTNLRELGKPYRGKVRDVYDLGQRLLSVASDRVSVFDVVLPDPIPDKGVVLTLMSRVVFKILGEDFEVTHHLLQDEEARTLVADTEAAHPEVIDHCLVWLRTEPLPVEFVVRRHITGSLLKAYQASKDGVVWGIQLPEGLKDGDDLGQVIFTPTTKARVGHDAPLTYKQYEALMEQHLGETGSRLAGELAHQSLALGEWAYDYCHQRGVIFADSKFEFGMLNGKAVLIDEILTPDSSRFWLKEDWQSGQLVSRDKQFVRDFTLKEAAAAGLKAGEEGFDDFVRQLRLPEEVIQQTTERYQQIEKILLD